jgi:hypothetical protein
MLFNKNRAGWRSHQHLSSTTLPGGCAEAYRAELPASPQRNRHAAVTNRIDDNAIPRARGGIGQSGRQKLGYASKPPRE